MEKNIITLSKWLVTKGEFSILKIQKLLFFIRYEEIKNKQNVDSYFKNDNNFQAWIYGPVSRESYDFLQPWFNKINEADGYYLDETSEDEIDKKYLSYYEKYSKYSPNELIDKSHKNLAWIKARGDCGVNDICHEFMKEDEDFLKFNNN